MRLREMDGHRPTKAELLQAWRDAAHASELATMASEAADKADLATVVSTSIALMSMTAKTLTVLRPVRAA